MDRTETHYRKPAQRVLHALPDRSDLFGSVQLQISSAPQSYAILDLTEPHCRKPDQLV